MLVFALLVSASAGCCLLLFVGALVVAAGLPSTGLFLRCWYQLLPYVVCCCLWVLW